MTVLSKFANVYDPLLFWKRLPDELLHEIANPLVRVKERHRRVMRELIFGPRRPRNVTIELTVADVIRTTNNSPGAHTMTVAIVNSSLRRRM